MWLSENPGNERVGENISDQPGAIALRKTSEPGRVEYLMLIAIMLFLNVLLHLITTHFGGSWDQDSSPVAQAAWTAVYLYALAGLLLERKRAATAIRQSLPINLLVGLILLSALWSTFPDMTLKRAFGLFGTTLIGYYIACRFRLPAFLDILVIATGVASIFSIITILFFHRIGIMQDEYAGAWQGIYGHKNILSNSMVLGIMTTVLLAAASKGRRRLGYIGLLTLFSVLLIGSRSATSLLIACVMVALIVCILLLRSKRFGSLTGITLGLGSAAATVAVLATGTSVQALFDLLGRDSTLTGRTDIWPYAIAAIGDRPFFGWGYKAFWLDNGPVQQYITTDWLPFHAHNGFLELSIDVGLVGTGIFVVGWAIGMARSMRLLLSQNDPLLLWPFATMLWSVLCNITESSLATYNSCAWVIFVTAFVFAMPQERVVAPMQRGYGDLEGTSHSVERYEDYDKMWSGDQETATS